LVHPSSLLSDLIRLDSLVVMREVVAVALGLRSNSNLIAKFFVPPLKSGVPGSGLCICNVGRTEGLSIRRPRYEATMSNATITRRGFNQFLTKSGQPPAVPVPVEDGHGEGTGEEVMTAVVWPGDGDGDTVGDTSARGLVDEYGISTELGDEDLWGGDGVGDTVGLIVGDGDEV
jgi:hypothetical protein